MKYRYEYPLFTFYDRCGIARHLEKMAAKGWMLDRIHTNFLWRYRRMEPADIHFEVTYFPEASEFEAEVPPDQQAFFDLCESAGWEFVAQEFQMQIFCNRQKTPIPLDTDPAIQVDTINQSMWRNYLFALSLLTAALVLMLLAATAAIASSPLRSLSNYGLVTLLTLMVFCLLYCALELGIYHFWYKKASRLAAEEQRFYPLPSLGRRWKLIFWGVCAIALLPFAFHGEWRIVADMLLSFVVIKALAFLGYSVRDVMRRLRVPGRYARWLFLPVALALSSALNTGRYQIRSLLPEAPRPHVTYTYENEERTAYTQDLPITMGDLLEIDDAHYSNRLTEQRTPFAAIFSGYQYRRLDAPETLPEEFYYHVYASPFPSFLEEEHRWTGRDFTLVRKSQDLKPKDATPTPLFGSEESWYRRTGKSHQYMLRYENALVQLSFDWEATDAQIETVLQALKSFTEA